MQAAWHAGVDSIVAVDLRLRCSGTSDLILHASGIKDARSTTVARIFFTMLAPAFAGLGSNFTQCQIFKLQRRTTAQRQANWHDTKSAAVFWFPV